MPTEKVIRDKALEQLEADNWTVWFPPRSRSYSSKDIFTIFDLVCHRPMILISRYIQLTTRQHIHDRRKKIHEYIKKTGLMFWGEIWGYDEKKALFVKEVITSKFQPAIQEA